VSLAAIAVLLLAVFLFVTAFFPGDGYIDRLSNAYAAVWRRLSDREFTLIMREQPWLYIIPAAGVVVLSGWLLPSRHWGRAVLIYLAFFLGYLAGHVFW